MTTLLRIAFRVEAAEKAYSSVWDFVDREGWKVKFQEEMVSAHLSGI